MTSFLLVGGRYGRHLHSQGRLHHPDQEAHHEVAEGQVAGPGQQSREAHAVQRNLWQEYQGVSLRFSFSDLLPSELIKQYPNTSSSSPRSILMRWRSSKWWLGTLAATGVRWRRKTSATAPPSRSPWRVSENGGWAADAARADVSSRSIPNVPPLQLLLLQRRSRRSTQIFCLPSRGRKCAAALHFSLSEWPLSSAHMNTHTHRGKAIRHT